MELEDALPRSHVPDVADARVVARHDQGAVPLNNEGRREGARMKRMHE